MTRKKLPIGIQTFSEVREEDYYYVDKTGFALRLIELGKYYFLSRPRRFGKSLFLDTLGELFAGNEPLFRGFIRARALGRVATLPGHTHQLCRRRGHRSRGAGTVYSRQSAHQRGSAGPRWAGCRG